LVRFEHNFSVDTTQWAVSINGKLTDGVFFTTRGEQSIAYQSTA
jgi:hypothetical protein